MPVTPVHELRLVLTVEEFEASVRIYRVRRQQAVSCGTWRQVPRAACATQPKALERTSTSLKPAALSR
jgi:hypothetical protein